jgi:hypothetical protein
MPKSTKKQVAPGPEETRQESQRRLVEQGERIAGVADAIEVYGRLSRYGGTVRFGLPTTRHATGANVPRMG